jgi:hypothetical protein
MTLGRGSTHGASHYYHSETHNPALTRLVPPGLRNSFDYNLVIFAEAERLIFIEAVD